MRDGDKFDLAKTFVQLRDDGGAFTVPVDENFWMEIGNRPELHGGRLVSLISYRSDWQSWEMHPAGEEFVCLLSGDVDLILDLPEGHKVVTLRERDAVLIPRGVWHTAKVRIPGEALHITAGAGTEHRPA